VRRRVATIFHSLSAIGILGGGNCFGGIGRNHLWRKRIVPGAITGIANESSLPHLRSSWMRHCGDKRHFHAAPWTRRCHWLIGGHCANPSEVSKGMINATVKLFLNPKGDCDRAVKNGRVSSGDRTKPAPPKSRLTFFHPMFTIRSHGRRGTGLFPSLVAGFENHSGWFS
jgi:hypothetical protein